MHRPWIWLAVVSLVLAWLCSVGAEGQDHDISRHVIPRAEGPHKRCVKRTPPPSDKEAYIDNLIANMTVTDLVLQLHLMAAANIVGPYGNNSLYDYAMRFSPNSSVGIMANWYTLNNTHRNDVQKLNLDASRVPIPFMQFGECLHGTRSFKQSIFPAPLGMSASFDTDLVYRVGRAIATEARSIGIHACFCPVLDLGQDARWGRTQEAWGEDKVLTSHMGVAFSSGLSKNSSWSDQDAVVPVMKHFAAHGSPQSGRNTAPFQGRGQRQVLQELMMPFKAAVELGGAKGVMMAYNELDEIPAVVHPTLYATLDGWGFDGFKIADDDAIGKLIDTHGVASSPADAIAQWFNAGGNIQFFDFAIDVYINSTIALVQNGTVPLETLQSHVKNVLGVKWDLGLFQDPWFPTNISVIDIVVEDRPLTLEAAQKSIVLLENKNSTLPLKPNEQNITKIALVGPFIDVLNYGDYTGNWGQYPADNATTLRQAIIEELNNNYASVELATSWGANTWEYNAQNVIPAYMLSANGTSGGLLGSYYSDTNFTTLVTQRFEVPATDWSLYPPPGLPSTSFSAVWEGQLGAIDTDVDGWIGVAVSAHTSYKLYIDGQLVASGGSTTSATNILATIEPYTFILTHNATAPSGSAPFTFQAGTTYDIRIEYVTTPATFTSSTIYYNSQVFLFWNLVSRNGDAIQQAINAASSADVVVLAVGAGWNSDGESGDRATLGLAPHQDALAQAIYATGKPVVLVLQGGRPFGIPQYYNASAAVLNTYFPGQMGGQAITDVLFGNVNPGGRLPLTIPREVGQVPAYYNYKRMARPPTSNYVDVDSSECYPFGYGLSYTTFELSGFAASVAGQNGTFSAGDTITFSVTVANNGSVAGSYVTQVYLLQRVSSITQPVRTLVAFQRVYLDAGQTTTVSMDLDVNRYLIIVNRNGQWQVEPGSYTFALMDNGGDSASQKTSITLQCV